MSWDNKQLCLKELNDYLDEVYKVAKPKMNKQTISEYTALRKKYA